MELWNTSATNAGGYLYAHLIDGNIAIAMVSGKHFCCFGLFGLKEKNSNNNSVEREAHTAMGFLVAKHQIAVQANAKKPLEWCCKGLRFVRQCSP